MTDSIRYYDRALARLSRRQVLNVAWKLGAAAVLYPLGSTRVLGQPSFRAFPFALGVASGDPMPDGSSCGRARPRPLEGGGMPLVAVKSAGRSRRRRIFAP